MSQHPPRRGELLRDYSLTASDGVQIMLSDFRGRQNLVLILLPTAIDLQQSHLLQSLAEKFGEVRQSETQVLVVTRPEYLSAVVNAGGDLPIFPDAKGSLLLELGAAERPAIYFTDKFREVMHAYRNIETTPSLEDILGWIEFVSLQCPECHPTEWPVVDSGE